MATRVTLTFALVTMVRVLECALLPLSSLVKPSNDICVEKLTNGCSVPSIGRNNIYVKEIFLPACTRHDVCYECGEQRGWTRRQCDESFYNNMKAICYHRYQNKRGLWEWLARGWKKILAGGNVAVKLVEWLTIPKETEEHCLHGAKIFYLGVSGFGDGHYGATMDPKYCRLPCVYRMANPNEVHID